MKKPSLLTFSFIASVAVLLPYDAMAQTNYIKANNTTALNTDGSYTIAGAPGTLDTIVFDSTITAGSLNIQVGTGGVSVNGLRIESTIIGTPIIAATAGLGLTLGTGGLTKESGTPLFRITAPIALSAPQTWNIATGTGTLRHAGGFSSGGNALLVQGAGTLELQNTVATTLGSEVTINIAQISISGNGNYTFGGTNTIDTLSIVSGRLAGSTLRDFGVASNFGDGGISTVITLGGSSTIGAVEYSGTTTSSNRTFIRNAPNAGNAGLANGIIDVSTAGQTLTLSGNLGSSSSVTNSGWSLGGNGNLTVSSNILDQASTGVTSLDKFGNGILTLSGTNSYEGATTVSAGTLLVNGSLANTSSVTVSSGATLGGSGTVAGATTINGTLAPGNSPGTMIYTNTLTLAGQTIMEIDGNAGAGVASGHDDVNLTGVGALGVLTTGGTLTLDIGTTFGTGIYSWDLFDFASETGTFSSVSLADQYTGSLTNTSGVWDLTSGGNTWQFTEATGVLGLTVAIPEPSTYAMLLGGLGLLAFLRRRSKS